jgi:NADPH:quinone reductase-like Zn-dependent oxidoreductase
MKAFIVDRYGKKRALRLADMPHPELRDDEVLVQIHAAGVNLLDSKIRDGEFKLILPYRLPLILGHDVAGVVVKVGPRVRSSSWAIRSMRDRMIFGSVRLLNSYPSRRLPWR